MSDSTRSNPGKGSKWPPEFIPVENTEELVSFLQEAARISAPATIWTKNQTLLFETQFSVFSPFRHVIYAAVPKELEPNSLKIELDRIKNNECFFSLTLARAILFFKTEYMEVDQAGFVFKVPDKIYKVQRRKDLRFIVPPSYTLKIEFNDPLYPSKKMVRKVVDLSAGGLSFLIPDDEMYIFSEGLILKNITLNIRSRKVITDGEVRHVRPERGTKRNSGGRVGIQFARLKELDAQLLASYVFEENRKFYSKFM